MASSSDLGELRRLKCDENILIVWLSCTSEIVSGTPAPNGHRKPSLLMDQNIETPLYAQFRMRGFDAVSVRDLRDLVGAPDQTIFDYAIGHNRVIVTHDKDFADPRMLDLVRSPGTVIFPGWRKPKQPDVAEEPFEPVLSHFLTYMIPKIRDWNGWLVYYSAKGHFMTCRFEAPPKHNGDRPRPIAYVSRARYAL